MENSFPERMVRLRPALVVPYRAVGGRDHGAKAVSWWGATMPPTTVAIGASTYVGMEFIPLVAGRIFGVRFVVPASTAGQHWAILYAINAPKLKATRMFFEVQNVSQRWVNAWIRPVFRVTPNALYRVAVKCDVSYFRTVGGSIGAPTHNNIQNRGAFATTSLDPIGAAPVTNTNANSVDILFYPD